MSEAHAELECEVCGLVTEHELVYAGRVLESVRCTRCGRHLVMRAQARVPAYLHDLEQRVSSKPGRMLRRTRQEPVSYLRRLPRAILGQPVKFARELRSLLRP